MQVIKEYIKKNDVKVIVIQRFMVNALVSKDDSSNPGPTDIFYLVKYLREECNIEPVICTTNINMFNDGYTYRHYTSIDWSSVDLCINQTNRYNLFGGVWREKVVDQLRVWTAGYEGLTYIMYTDPSIVWTNPFVVIVDKGRNRERYGGLIVVDPAHVQKFANKKIEGLFIGKDFDLFKSLATKKDDPIWPTVCHKFDLVQYIIENEWEEARSEIAPIDNSLFDFSDKKIEQPKDTGKIHDIVYFGSNRPGRGKILRSLFKKNTSLNKKWIGYDPNFDAETTITTEPVPRGELKQHLDGCKVSFVIGDPAHNDNMFTYRIFENAIMECLSVIWHEFDSKHYIFKNKELSRFYVETIEDIENLIKHLDEDSSRIPYYLELQQSEIREYSKTWR